jgi:hypothetical protein
MRLETAAAAVSGLSGSSGRGLDEEVGAFRRGWARTDVDRPRRTRSPVKGGHGWMGTRERHSGLEEDVDAVWLAGWLVQMLTGHGGRGRRSKADTAGTGNRYRGKDGGKVMADMACRS